ncbi:MAG: PEP-CTERM sorting domain-containing protein [Verrucomicrobiota bacterium]
MKINTFFTASTCLVSALFVVPCLKAEFTLAFDGGYLYGADTSSPLQEGRLIYAVTSATNTFSGPVDGSFVSGDEYVLGSWTVDTEVAGLGSFSVVLNGLSLNASVVTGQQIGLYWFDELNFGSLSPSSGDSYGFYSDAAWLIPADGATGSYSLITSSLDPSGVVADSNTIASLTVGAIPEPSSFALLFGAAAIGMVGCRRRQRA